MAAFPENGDETGERSSAAPTGSSLCETDSGSALSGSHNEQHRQAANLHSLIESGCIREFAVRVLNTTIETTDTASEAVSVLEIDQLTESGAQQAIKRIQQLQEYKQTAALIEKHGRRPTATQHTLTAHIETTHTTWVIVVFEMMYPNVEVVYPIVARPTDRDTSPVTAIIDPNHRPGSDSNSNPSQCEADESATITAFKITTERVVPTTLSLDTRMSDIGTDEEHSSEQVGYQIAIDWFVS